MHINTETPRCTTSCPQRQSMPSPPGAFPVPLDALRSRALTIHLLDLLSAPRPTHRACSAFGARACFLPRFCLADWTPIANVGSRRAPSTLSMHWLPIRALGPPHPVTSLGMSSLTGAHGQEASCAKTGGGWRRRERESVMIHLSRS